MNTISAVLEAAKSVNSPVIIQLSYGGAHFIAGKSINNGNLSASVLGAVLKTVNWLSITWMQMLV